ncbi:hypothetical protein J2S30_003210 [Herbaspirillum rubrisubalbicans]|uniref:hypothetical protein n=1 Tax=Herbaspirillum rubrisubalbicans TaxID=80842 RepID=UPI00209F6203|nr:hypothetical protein [Herbaspirillum rubrisubalbicans]MCP1574831.1 hypothetical protein [Herbaspirillum rubrisubalbicans]
MFLDFKELFDDGAIGKRRIGEQINRNHRIFCATHEKWNLPVKLAFLEIAPASCRCKAKFNELRRITMKTSSNLSGLADASHAFSTDPAATDSVSGNGQSARAPDRKADSQATQKALTYSGRSIREQMLKEMGCMSDNAFIMTMAQCRALPNWKKVDGAVTSAAERLGFTRPSPTRYRHTGARISADQAFTELMKANRDRPLLFSSASAMQAAVLLSFLKNSGNDAFNVYVGRTRQQQLEIGESDVLPAKLISHYCSRYEIVESELPHCIEHGDIVCMEGPHDSAIWHPGKDANTLNLFGVDKSSPDAPIRLIGLTSVSQAGEGPLEPGALRQRFLDHYHAPQTVREFALFEQAKEDGQSGADGHWSPYSAYRWVEQHQPEALKQARAFLAKLNDLQQARSKSEENAPELERQIDELLNTSTTIVPPQTDKIRGALYHSKPLDFSLNDLLDRKREASTIAPNVTIGPGEDGRPLFPYAANSPAHQQQMFSAAKAFYDRCMNPEFAHKFDGLVLHGDADTGIGLGSEVLVDNFIKQGLHVWTADVGANAQWVQQTGNEEKEAQEAAIAERFQSEWKNADVLVINATGQDEQAFSRTACAMLDHAREHGKKVVITSHQNPFDAFSAHIETPYDALSIRHIARDAEARNRFPESVWSEVYVSTDVETDGPIPGDNSMLSFGAAAYMADKTLLSTFSANLELLPGAKGNPGTMAWWQTQPEAWAAARKDLRDPKEAMRSYVQWVKSQPASKPVFVAYPAGFDFMFMYWYMIHFESKSPFSFSAMDMRSYASATLGSGYRESGKDNMPASWKDPLEHDHTGVNDAIEQGAIFCNMLAANHDRRNTEAARQSRA